MSFRAKIRNVSKNIESNIILALDFPYEDPKKTKDIQLKAEKVIDTCYRNLCAVKFNHHLVLPLGLFDGVQSLIRRVHDLGLVAIMDCKLNDIGSTNEVIAQYYYAAGFDALIANPFVGLEDGLKPVFDVARGSQRGVILLAYMSHKGANEGYGQTVIENGNEKALQYVSFAKKALKWKADGVVVGATYPQKIREVHEILKDKIPIYAPGVGAQGGEIKTAMSSGAQFLIVGRAITQAADPGQTARQVRDLSQFVGDHEESSHY